MIPFIDIFYYFTYIAQNQNWLVTFHKIVQCTPIITYMMNRMYLGDKWCDTN